MSVDVLVVGGGIAGLTAAITAAEAGAQVRLVDAAERADRGGNTRWSIGISRVAHSDRAELEKLLDAGMSFGEVDVPSYPADRFHADLVRVSRGDGNRTLQRLVADGSLPLARWLRDHGVRWKPAPFRFGRAAPDREPGLAPGAELMVRGGGAALVDALLDAAHTAGVEVRFGIRVRALCTAGVELADGTRLTADAAVLACGGIEGSRAMRARYLGPGWDLVRIRGTRHNTGALLEAALAAGAAPAGHWSGVHAVASDPHGPPYGDPVIGDVHGRYSYPYGITVDARGERFLDEGADEKNLTYATIGPAIHARGGTAYQVFDASGTELLEPRYAQSTPVVADTVEKLAHALGLPRLVETVRAFNTACPDGEFDPADLDGLAAQPPGQPPKSNWAVPLTRPPFRAYRVTPAVTFAFAGLAIDADAQVRDEVGRPLPGLLACGDAVGGIAVHNLPAGTGMIAAGVLGRIAGATAARRTP
ncbi:FAD-dependent tricarballylate dehydrogenase TcuA [Pseudonocardia kujensis]|uniref:FAD-dependent tricarballylate dehydrogenase TcuA n=1 Tax=Pseudonocardia kujensis TaxID=1128675 RepID=UPI001E47CF27|nr:FAD-dependent tricarballylate dehydrogenase TcuA [Pseudonocardia kujensis]MCE0765570.1 FAD-dependent tricarballylate dehydrogenase TcuA [Pseudonocardia kujensis]